MTKKEGRRLSRLLAKRGLTQAEVDELQDLAEKLGCEEDVSVNNVRNSMYFNFETHLETLRKAYYEEFKCRPFFGFS